MLGREITVVQTCRVCGQSKEVEAFGFRNKATGRRHRKCKACMAAYGRAHYARNRQAYITRNVSNMRVRRRSLKERLWRYVAEQACVDCGERDPLVLDFDHVNTKHKRAEIYWLVQSTCSWTLILDEIAKCQVRCANCHRRRTAAQFDWPKRGLSGSAREREVDLTGLEPVNLSDANRALSQLSYRPGTA